MVRMVSPASFFPALLDSVFTVNVPQLFLHDHPLPQAQVRILQVDTIGCNADFDQSYLECVSHRNWIIEYIQSWMYLVLLARYWPVGLVDIPMCYSSVHQVNGHVTNPSPRQALRGGSLTGIPWLPPPYHQCSRMAAISGVRKRGVYYLCNAWVGN